MRKGKVFFDKIPAGIITEDDEGFIFKYDEKYLQMSDAKPVSLTLPLKQKIFRDKNLFPFFDGLIPEGWLLEIAEKNWKLDPNDRMGLLLACCNDCIGAVSIIEEAEADNEGDEIHE